MDSQLRVGLGQCLGEADTTLEWSAAQPLNTSFRNAGQGLTQTWEGVPHDQTRR